MDTEKHDRPAQDKSDPPVDADTVVPGENLALSTESKVSGEGARPVMAGISSFADTDCGIRLS